MRYLLPNFVLLRQFVAVAKNRENPPSPNNRLSKGAKIADITASAKASDKTAVCIVLKQRSNSGNYGQVLYLGKRMADRQGLEDYRLKHPYLLVYMNIMHR